MDFKLLIMKLLYLLYILLLLHSCNRNIYEVPLRNTVFVNCNTKYLIGADKFSNKLNKKLQTFFKYNKRRIVMTSPMFCKDSIGIFIIGSPSIYHQNKYLMFVFEDKIVVIFDNTNLELTIKIYKEFYVKNNIDDEELDEKIIDFVYAQVRHKLNPSNSFSF